LNYTEAGIVVIDPDSHVIVDANPAAIRMLGTVRKKVIGRKCFEFICPAKKGKCPMTDFGEKMDSSESILIKTNREKRPVLKTIAPIILKGKRHLLESFVDISKLKKAEEDLKKAHDNLEMKVQERTEALRESQAHLIQAEKLGALGTMTAGIAHELNNPMMGMLNFIQYCLKHTEKSDRRYSILEDAERETKRCSDIVKNLLTFSRMESEGEEEYEKVPIKRIIDRVTNLLTYRIEKENVTLKQHMAKETPEIWIKISNIQQVFLNLVGNALDAVKESTKKEIHLRVEPNKEYVHVSVSDSGCGIEPKIFNRIFDPFFTTKSPGRGTGLGLSVCQSIIKNHGGDILCDSEAGKGTKFTVLLPVERKQKF
jgi:PAS domain S-box-containing protein